MNTGIVNKYAFDLVTDGTSIFAGTEAGCFVTTDDGANWTLAVNGMKGSYITDLVNTGSVIMACTNGGGIYT